MRVLHTITNVAAVHPKTTIITVVVFTIAIFGIGFVTNFDVDVDEDTLWYVSLFFSAALCLLIFLLFLLSKDSS